MASNTTKRIRVLVVDDSAFMRKVLERLIASDPQMEVAGQAKDGHEAVLLADSLKPDVITMDINMPRMDGLQATALIMSKNPRPIVIVSSESREGADSTLRALELGAIEFVSKPSSGIDLDMKSVSDDLLRKLRMAAKVRVIRTASGRNPAAVPNHRDHSSARTIEGGSRTPPRDTRFPVVVIAASTGGPATVMRLAPGFTSEFPGAVILVQHMPAPFTSQFAVQLAEFTSIPVKDAEHNESLQPGHLYVCPGSHHLRVTPAGRIQLDASGRINGYLPNIDVTMESVAAYAGGLSLGVVLTGMGNDGANGVRAIKAAGGFVIAQDEATAVIFGMPAEAIKTGAVDQVLGIDDIYATLEKRVLNLCRAAPAGVR
ncbi:MAG TPA: chemotaxis response regulator protein-glutamate methylesterase [Candidatus Dormibacteraeota bacterium]|nr:chemotaxis response regulator protein-glutamate methylesterase [Candidatus Dormibacteraeota bacterium]